MSSTREKNIPIIHSFIDYNVERIEQDNFCYFGNINGKDCSFRIDTASDVSILNSNLLENDMERVRIK